MAPTYEVILQLEKKDLTFEYILEYEQEQEQIELEEVGQRPEDYDDYTGYHSEELF